MRVLESAVYDDLTMCVGSSVCVCVCVWVGGFWCRVQACVMCVSMCVRVCVCVCVCVLSVFSAL